MYMMLLKFARVPSYDIHSWYLYKPHSPFYLLCKGVVFLSIGSVLIASEYKSDTTESNINTKYLIFNVFFCSAKATDISEKVAV